MKQYRINICAHNNCGPEQLAICGASGKPCDNAAKMYGFASAQELSQSVYDLKDALDHQRWSLRQPRHIGE